MRSFQSHQGKITRVELASGTASFLIKSVQGDTVQADRVLEQDGRVIGRSPANFTFSQLSPQRAILSIGRANAPEEIMATAIMKGKL